MKNMKIYDNITQLVGNTPLVRLNSIEKEFGLKAQLYGKLEALNPAGSAKDRVGLAMIEDAEKRGILKPGSVIIEPTSGNTGIGLASAAASKGYKVILTMPDTMSVERRNLLKAYGAQLVLTEGARGMQGAVEKAEELAAQTEGSFIPVGNTPLVRLNSIEKEFGLKAQLYGKLEALNPAGSAKDRVGLAMIEDAEKRGILKPGSVIIEPTSGNTGIGLASAAASKGYKVILTMPDTMSVERRNLLKAYGAQLVLTEGARGMQGAVEKAEELAAQTEGSFIPGQFDNPVNPKIHYETTGPEIYDALDGKIDIFVAGVGTGGTITGAGRYLKEKNPQIKIIAVEPSRSPLLSQGKAGPHGLQGIGANFIPSILDTSVYDEILTVSDEDAYSKGRLIAAKEGVLVGITSGAAVHAAVVAASRPENEGKNIVAFLPDTGDRYLSTPMFV